MKLLTFSRDWSDEFQCEEFTIMEDEAYALWQENLAKLFEKKGTFEVYFGTNEAHLFDDIVDFMYSIDVEDITDKEAEVLQRLFPSLPFGTGGVFNQYLFSDLNDEDEEE